MIVLICCGLPLMFIAALLILVLWGGVGDPRTRNHR